MRRIIGTVLIGLGVAGIVLAVLFPTVVVSGSKKTPLDLDITQISSGPAKVFDSATNQVKDENLRAIRIVRSDTKASDDKNTTVNESLCIVANVPGDNPQCLKAPDPRLLSVTTDRVTTDRKTAEAVHVPEWNEAVNGDTSVRHQGLAYKWPIDAQKKTYLFYQPDVKQAFPAVYKGESKIRGLKVYQYVSETGDVPYKIQGLFDGTYNDTRTVWVEPRTGAIIDGVEHQVQTLADGQVALDTTLRFDKSAIDYQSNFAKDKIKALQMAQIWAPIVCGVLGIAALVGGILLLRSRGTSTGGDEGGQGRHTTPPPTEPPGYGETPEGSAPTQTYAGSSQT